MKDLRQVLFVFAIAIWGSIPTSSWASPELMQAIKTGNLEQVKALVQAGADINFRHWENGIDPIYSGPLGFAVIHKKPEIVEWLLNAGASLREECIYSSMTKTLARQAGMGGDWSNRTFVSPYKIALMEYHEGVDPPSVRAIIGHLLKDRIIDPHTQYDYYPGSGFALALMRIDAELVQIFLKHSTPEEFSKRHSGTLTFLKQRFIDEPFQAGDYTLGGDLEVLRDLFGCINPFYIFPKYQKNRKNLIDSGISREALASSSSCTSQSTPASTSKLHHLLPIDILMLIISYEDDNSENSEISVNFNGRLDSLKKALESYDCASRRVQEHQECLTINTAEANIDWVNSEIGKLYFFQFIKKKQLNASLSKWEEDLNTARDELTRKDIALKHLVQEQISFKKFIGDLQLQLSD